MTSQARPITAPSPRGRLLGDWRRQDGYPWASPRWQLTAMLRRSDLVDVRRHQLESAVRRLGYPVRIPQQLALLAHALPWQKVLGRRRARAAPKSPTRPKKGQS